MNNITICNLENILRDSIINKISIDISNTESGIILVISAEKKSIKYTVKFSDVEYYNINYDRERGYQYIENIKIIEINDGYYISLDPYTEGTTIDERDDNNFYAKAVEFKEKTDDIL